MILPNIHFLDYNHPKTRNPYSRLYSRTLIIHGFGSISWMSIIDYHTTRSSSIFDQIHIYIMIDITDHDTMDLIMIDFTVLSTYPIYPHIHPRSRAVTRSSPTCSPGRSLWSWTRQWRGPTRLAARGARRRTTGVDGEGWWYEMIKRWNLDEFWGDFDWFILISNNLWTHHFEYNNVSQNLCSPKIKHSPLAK